MARDFDIEVPRQGDWVKEIQLTDVAGVPIDITGHTVEWHARRIAGDGAIVARATIAVLEAEQGRISATWHGPTFTGIGLHTEIVRVAHDLKDTYPGGTVDVVFRGHIALFPEVTV